MQKHTAKTIQDLIGFLPSPGAVTYVNDNLSNKEESAWSDKDYVFELACEFMGDFAKTVRELWAGTFGEEMQLDPDPQCVELGNWTSRPTAEGTVRTPSARRPPS
jgi:hypothetical protein